MADIQYKYKGSTHTISNYDEILSTYNWIADALNSIFRNYDEIEIHCNIAFSTGEMSYECNSIDEFKKYAFGKSIQIKRMLVYAYKNWEGSLIEIFAVNHNQEEQDFELSSKDEMILINLKEALLNNKKSNFATDEKVIMQITDNSITIGDNNQISNSVIGGNNKTSVKQNSISIEDKKETFWSKFLWLFLVPIVVGVIVGILIYYFNLN